MNVISLVPVRRWSKKLKHRNHEKVNIQAWGENALRDTSHPRGIYTCRLSAADGFVKRRAVWTNTLFKLLRCGVLQRRRIASEASQEAVRRCTTQCIKAEYLLRPLANNAIANLVTTLCQHHLSFLLSYWHSSHFYHHSSSNLKIIRSYLCCSPFRICAL